MQISQFVNFNWAGISFCLGMLALVIGAGFASNGLRRRRQPRWCDRLHALTLDGRTIWMNAGPVEPQPEPHELHLIDLESSVIKVHENGTIEAQCCIEHCQVRTILHRNLRAASVARIK